MINKLTSPFLFIVCLFVAACSDNNDNEPIIPFSLEKNYYEVRQKRGADCISITNGSGDISLAMENANILQAMYAKYEDNREDNRKGHINLYGTQKGTTTLTITDNVTGDKATAEVKVTDCYLAYVINDSNYPVLKAGTTLFLVNNQADDCYLFAKDNIRGQFYDRAIVKGNYEFFVAIDANAETASQRHHIPNLRLTYPSDAERKPTDATAVARSHDFQIEMWGEDASSSYVINYIQGYLGVDWEELFNNAITKSPAPIDLTMTLTVPGTDYRIKGVLSNVSMPEHILD